MTGVVFDLSIPDLCLLPTVSNSVEGVLVFPRALYILTHLAYIIYFNFSRVSAAISFGAIIMLLFVYGLLFADDTILCGGLCWGFYCLM